MYYLFKNIVKEVTLWHIKFFNNCLYKLSTDGDYTYIILFHMRLLSLFNSTVE